MVIKMTILTERKIGISEKIIYGNRLISISSVNTITQNITAANNVLRIKL